jgi:peroxidase
MGAVPLDPITPNLVNPNFFDLVMAKKMPLTVDHLMGMDRGRHPDQLAKPRGDDGLL